MESALRWCKRVVFAYVLVTTVVLLVGFVLWSSGGLNGLRGSRDAIFLGCLASSYLAMMFLVVPASPPVERWVLPFGFCVCVVLLVSAVGVAHMLRESLRPRILGQYADAGMVLVSAATVMCHATAIAGVAIQATLLWSLCREQRLEPLHPSCGRCGYNLSGNVSGRCPECGGKLDEEPDRR